MRLLSRLTLGDAGTIIASSASTRTGAFDAVTALTQATATLVISGATTTATIGGGVTIYGDISSVINSSGGQLAVYVRKD